MSGRTQRAFAQDQNEATTPVEATGDPVANPIEALPQAPEDATPTGASADQETSTPPAGDSSAPTQDGSTDLTEMLPDLSRLRVFETTPIPTLPIPTLPLSTSLTLSTPPAPSVRNPVGSAMEKPASQKAEMVLATPQDNSLRALARGKGLTLPLPNARIVIHKAPRRLDLISGSTLVKSYRVALGKNPSGAKKTQGDNRTPEGHFYICMRNATTSDFHVFLGLSYPALPDAKRALSSKQITWREYQIINQRLTSRGRPLWETKLGGWVGIHGGTDDEFAQKTMRERGSRDWTAGCVALNNREIEEIYSATQLGTPVEVKP